MGYLELMLMNTDSSIAVCDLIKPKDIVSRGFNEIEEMHDADYYFEKGLDAEKQNNFPQAVSWFQKALQVKPEHERALFNLGYCYLPSNCHLGFPMKLYGIDESVCSRRAVKCLEKLIDLRKSRKGLQATDSTAFNNLGCAYGNLGKEKEEEEAYRYAVKLDEKDHFPLDNLGTVFISRDLFDEAERFYVAAFNANKNYLITHYHLGMLYERKKQNEDAIKWYRSYLEKVDKTLPWEKDHVEYAAEAIERMKGKGL